MFKLDRIRYITRGLKQMEVKENIKKFILSFTVVLFGTLLVMYLLAIDYSKLDVIIGAFYLAALYTTGNGFSKKK